MNIRIQKTGGRSYLIYTSDHPEDLFAGKMIEKNTPTWILPIAIDQIDQLTEYRYDISEVRKLEPDSEKEEWTPEEIRLMMIQVLNLQRQTEDYLLNVSQIDLSPEHVFTDEKGHLLFCYEPEAAKDYDESMLSFFWDLLTRMDHTDGVHAGQLYSLYHQMQKKQIVPQDAFLQMTLPTELRDHSAVEQKKSDNPKMNEEHSTYQDQGNPSGKKFHPIGAFFEQWLPHSDKSSEEKEEIVDSHCFLRSCGEVILETAELASSPFLIGRSRPDCDLWLTDPSVSRIHAKLIYEKGSWYVTDAGSANGTKWNRQPVKKGEKKKLKPGDQLSFAGTVYVFDQIEEGTMNRLDNPNRSA